MSDSLWCQVLERMSCVQFDIFNNINFNRAAEEVLLFRWELMKRKRHTYGTLFLSFFFFVSHPSIYAQIHMPYGKARMTRSKSSMHFQSFSKCRRRIKKGLPLLSCVLPWAHESEGCSRSPFNDGAFFFLSFFVFSRGFCFIWSKSSLLIHRLVPGLNTQCHMLYTASLPYF